MPRAGGGGLGLPGFEYGTFSPAGAGAPSRWDAGLGAPARIFRGRRAVWQILGDGVPTGVGCQLSCVGHSSHRAVAGTAAMEARRACAGLVSAGFPGGVLPLQGLGGERRGREIRAWLGPGRFASVSRSGDCFAGSYFCGINTAAGILWEGSINVAFPD